MGINGGSKFSAIISDVPVLIFLSILRDNRAKNGQNHHLLPAIDVDINFLIKNNTKDADPINSRANKVVDIMIFITKYGYDVIIICDPKIRHHIKRA